MEQSPLKSAVPQLRDDVEAEVLRRNVEGILDTLRQNRYREQEPAKLIAVTKTVTPRVINLLKPLQILDIGENRAQVALPKLDALEPEFRLHWIGRLQTNKVKYIIDKVCMLHTLDRLPLAQEVNRRAAEHEIVLPTLVQVNIAGEEQKGGMPPQEVLSFLKQMKDFSSIRIMGLMSIMPLGAEPAQLRELFAGMRRLFDEMRMEGLEHVEMRELSMGMSGDYAIAAAEGATMVRVGTALYKD